jgi:Resolvase, N terminal domain
MTAPVRAALHLRVSTGRQADNDLSIPDQRRQARAYCASRGWEIVADYVSGPRRRLEPDRLHDSERDVQTILRFQLPATLGSDLAGAAVFLAAA